MPEIREPQRPDLYVLARFLDKLSTGVPYSRSRLQAAVRLNYDLFRSYLCWLEARGLVAVQSGAEREVIAITPKGQDAHRRLVGWIESVLGQAWR